MSLAGAAEKSRVRVSTTGTFVTEAWKSALICVGVSDTSPATSRSNLNSGLVPSQDGSASVASSATKHMRKNFFISMNFNGKRLRKGKDSNLGPTH